MQYGKCSEKIDHNIAYTCKTK